MFEIRLAVPDDATAIARVHIDGWKATYGDVLPRQELEALDVSDRSDSWRTALQSKTVGGGRNGDGHSVVVAFSGDSLVGWATFGVARDAERVQAGELSGLYVAPAFWGQGAGGAMIRYTEAALVGQGYGWAYLWMLNGNGRAARFYRNHGWEADGRTKTSEVLGRTIPLVSLVKFLDSSTA